MIQMEYIKWFIKQKDLKSSCETLQLYGWLLLDDFRQVNKLIIIY